MAVDKIEMEIFIDDRKADAVLRQNKAKIDNFTKDSGASLANLSVPISTIAAVATTAATAIALLVTKAAEYGSVIFDASQKTGLSAESISALRFAADNASSSLGQVTGGIAKFSKTVSDAANGSAEAAEKIKALGVDPQSALTNLDGALETVFKRIAAAPAGIQQVALAQAAFGRSGADLIPVILQAGGSFAGMKDEAEKLGITLSGDSAKAADDFGDSVGKISAQAESAASRFALQFTPQITKALNAISDDLANSKDKWTEWGDNISNILGGIEKLIQPLTGKTGIAGLLETSIASFLIANPTLGAAIVGLELTGRADAVATAGASGAIARGSIPDEPPGIKGTGLAFTDDEKWKQANKKYFDDFQNGVKQAAANEKQYAADRKKMLDDAIKKAKEWADYITNAKKTIADVFASTTDNPFVKIFSDGEKAIDRVTAATGRLSVGLQNTLIELINNQTAAAVFGQALDNKLKAFGLRDEARQFRAGALDTEDVSAKLQRQLAAIGAGGSANFQSRDFAFNDVSKQIGAELARSSTSAANQSALDQRIIALTQGIDPAKLTTAQNATAAAAREREAKRLDDEQSAAKKLIEKQNQVLADLTKAIERGAVVKIINKAKNRAEVESRPSSETTKELYENF